ncbi:hypothetical protein AB4427_09735 [Vibrio artabrorum]|uniref:hypothetical protein n=1 Tax=Vibrio artabrorum TaxID=446374 RepID=UPI00354C623B
MQLPHRVVLRDKKQLKRHRKLTPAAYECVIEQGGQLIRYYRDVPAVRLGDALKEQLEQSGDAIGTLIFFQPFDALWYGGAFEDGVLVREHMGSVASLGSALAYELHHAPHLLVAGLEGGEPESALPFFPDKQVKVVGIEPDAWQAFTLAPVASTALNKRTKALIGLGLIGCALAGIGGVVSTSSTSVVPPKPVTSAPSEESMFMTTLMSRPLAYPLIMNAIAMAIEAQTLPHGMVLSTLTLNPDSNQLMGTVEKGDSRRKSRRDWASKAGRQSQWVEEAAQLRSKALATAPWQDVDVAAFLPAAIDALEQFGVTVSPPITIQHGRLLAQQYTLSMTGTLGELALLAPILNASFITATAFNMTVAGDVISQFTLNITVQGVNHDR